MGLLVTEMVAKSGTTLSELVQSLEDEIGAFRYDRIDIRLAHPVAKKDMIDMLIRQAPAEIGGVQVAEISTKDGVKYILEDDGWLLIRPSGTEPVLRVYAEGHSDEMVRTLLNYGNTVADRVK